MVLGLFGNEKTNMGFKLAGLMFVLMLAMGGAGYWYYTDSQARMATLRENNARLEVAVETAQASIDSLRRDMQRMNELNNKLQKDLQAAEAYGDELQSKLNRMDLVQDALRDAKQLEGKMNGATAKLWRGITEDTGGDGSRPLPDWLQPIQPSSGTGDQGGDQDRKDNSANSESPQASTAQ